MANKNKCSVSMCERLTICRELCAKHYHKWQRYGDATVVKRDFGNGTTREERFWSKVNKDGPTMPHMDTPCWEWTGGLLKSGYGEVTFHGKTQSTHRVVWFLAYGRFPEPCGLHRCDNRSCVRLDHLYEGTRKQNHQDMIARGRKITLKGEASCFAKLTEGQVLAIRADTRPQHMVALDHNVDQSTISDVKRRKTWQHI